MRTFREQVNSYKLQKLIVNKGGIELGRWRDMYFISEMISILSVK